MHNPYDDNYLLDVTRTGLHNAEQSISEIFKRLERVEYICRRIEEIKPDISKTYCAGCKYLFYGTAVGLGVSDKCVELCMHNSNRYYKPGRSTDGKGCYKWEKRDGESND